MWYARFLRIQTAFVVAAAVLLVAMPFSARADELNDIAAAPEEAQMLAAQNLLPDEYSVGKITSLVKEGERNIGGENWGFKIYEIRIIKGKEKGRAVFIELDDFYAANKNRSFKIGDSVIVVKSYQLDTSAKYYIADSYRLKPLIFIALLFLLAAIIFGRLRGFTSVLGLATTVGVIVAYLVPQIASGANPYYVSLAAAAIIATLSLFLAHGFSVRTTIAYVGTLLALGLSALLAASWVTWARLFGMGSEEALFLQGSELGDINLRGLLLGGIILGVLGILDDITTAQAAVVEELKRANPKLTFAELYRRGLSVGREHIASLINTLFLVYAGASLPLFLLFAVNKIQPLWFIVNSESIAEEIVRTLVGSVCLILAVPITTALAALFYGRRKQLHQDKSQP